MALLKRKNETPPGTGKWEYLQAESGATISAENFYALVDLVVAHRAYRGFARANAEEASLDIQRQVCQALGTAECKKEGPSDAWTPRIPERQKITMGDVISFSKATLAFVASGGALAPMDEVTRRAAICRACSLNRPMTGCSCNTFYKLIEAAVPKERRIDGLHVCGVCHCSNTAKVNLTDEQVISSNEGRNLIWPEGQDCWQRDLMQRAPTS